MKREYFGMLFMVVCVAMIFLAIFIFGNDKVMDNLSRFIVVWILVGFQVGQYSMRFPKAF